jgi:hypothetical protein
LLLQVLEVDVDSAAAGVLPVDEETRKPDIGTAQRHNLEVRAAAERGLVDPWWPPPSLIWQWELE